MQAFRETHPDLVLLDRCCRVWMASTSAARSAPSRRPDRHADGEERHRRRGARAESSADDYIVKPFKSKELIARVAPGCGGRATRRRRCYRRRRHYRRGRALGEAWRRGGEPHPAGFDCWWRWPQAAAGLREVLLEQVWGTSTQRTPGESRCPRISFAPRSRRFLGVRGWCCGAGAWDTRQGRPDAGRRRGLGADHRQQRLRIRPGQE
jgi:hypothetical protein